VSLVDAMDIAYAVTPDGAKIAYAVLGERDPEILFVGTGNFSFEATADSPLTRQWYETLSSLGRLVTVDHRGVGRSDPLPPNFTFEQRVDDLVSVLDATARGPVFAVGLSTGAAAALALAARHPERVKGVIAFNGFARTAIADDYAIGRTHEGAEEFARRITNHWGTGRFLARSAAPGRLDDQGFLRMAGRLERLSGSPAAALAVERLNATIDVRGALAHVLVPVLVVERTEPYGNRPPGGTDLASRLPNARYVQLARDESMGRFDDVRAELSRFIAGNVAIAADRVLTTVLVTDIVGSTARAVEMGDVSWRQLLDHHDRIVREYVEAAGGRVVKTTGDGVLAMIPIPSSALACARSVQRALGTVDLRVRCGLHVGEVEHRGDDVGGVAVHVACRIAALAGAGEILATATLAGVVAGSDAEFEAAGHHDLKGLPGEWEVVRLV